MSPSMPVADRPASPRFLPVLMLLFVGSGCAALIYEIVWFQMLQLVIGSSGVSLGVLLGTFMGGMCLGSLALPRIVSARHHPLRVYAMLEAGIGILGIVVLYGMPYVGRLYIAGAGHGLKGILLRGMVAAVCLLPPTLLMGASLPAMARWVQATPKGVSWLGFFYGGNIAGAVCGCLLAGFYLLRVYDMPTATFAAAALNGAVALTGLGLAAATPHWTADGGPAQTRSERPRGVWPVYVAIALSGFCALGAEVIWTRLLSLMLGATVYTFSIILAVVLLGLGIGSSAGSFLARETARPRIALGFCQMFLAAAVAWTAYALANSLPYWPVNPSLSTSPWFTFQLDLARCLWSLLPAACLWGASFPLALAAAASRGQDPGRLVAGVYAANTAGAILGAAGFSMVLIARIGTQQSQRLLIGLSALAALIVLAPLVRRFWARAVAMAVAMGLAVLLVWSVPTTPWGVVAYGRRMNTSVSQAHLIYMGEGMNASIAVTEWNDGARLFHVSGKVEASTEQQDMRLQKMLGHIPALLHPKPESVLVVGCGAGVTAGSFVLHPEVAKIVICEIEPLIPPAAAKYFGRENHNVLRDRRTQLVYDDARHYILTSQEKFDIITSDPIHPWVKGTATLYSKEYYELCKRHLKPGGVITQWVPLYESDTKTVKSEIATFFEVFPGGTIWSNDVDGSGYDVLLLGQAGEAPIDIDQLQRRLDSVDHLRVTASLREVGLGSAFSLLSTYAGRGPDLRLWLKGAEINRDRNLRLQYLAGMGLNTDQRYGTYTELLRHRKFPDDLFAGAPEHKQKLREFLGN